MFAINPMLAINERLAAFGLKPFNGEEIAVIKTKVAVHQKGIYTGQELAPAMWKLLATTATKDEAEYIHILLDNIVKNEAKTATVSIDLLINI